MLKFLFLGKGPLIALSVLAAFGIVLSYVGTERYYAGVEKERIRGQQVIAKMVWRHAAALKDANARVDSKSEELRELRERIQREYTALQIENRRRLAAVVAERDGLREQLSTYAFGGVEASRDSIQACRDRAAALGRVLDRVVQDYAICTGSAEDNAEGLRTLQVWSDTVEQRVREIGEQQ